MSESKTESRSRINSNAGVEAGGIAGAGGAGAGGTPYTGIFVTDFDLTFTDRHTMGHPVIGQYYFSIEQYQKLLKCLYFLKKKGWLVYINTRASQCEVNAYIKFLNIHNMIDGVFGSSSESEMDEPDIYWCNKKVKVLDDIRSLHGDIPKDDIFYLDDFYPNVNGAFLLGYKYAFHSMRGSRNFISFAGFISDKMIKPNDIDQLTVTAKHTLDAHFRLPECHNNGQTTKLYKLDTGKMLLKTDLLKFVKQDNITMTYIINDKVAVWDGCTLFPTNTLVSIWNTSDQPNDIPE